MTGALAPSVANRLQLQHAGNTARTHGGRPVGIPPDMEWEAHIQIRCRRLSSDASQSHWEGEVVTSHGVFVI